MNISLSETFKKVTSVTLIFGLVFSTLTPAAFAAIGATFVATETVANEAIGATAETVTHTDITANVIEVKATRTIDVQSLPANNSTIKVGTCTITFQSISGSTSDELDCSDDAATIDRNTGPGNNNRTASSIAGRIRALTNVGSTNHGTLVVSGSGTEAIFTTSTSFIENTASAVGFSGTAAGVSVLSTNSVSSVIPVKQETSITIGWTVDVGDTFTVTSGPFGTASFVATTTSTSDVATGLNAAIQAHPNYPTRNFTTSVAGNVITLTSKTAGTSFTTLTPTTTNFPGTAQVVTFTPATPTDGLTYRANINGTNYDYTVIGTKTVTEVVTALQVLMDTAIGVSCTHDGTKVTCTADSAGTPFTSYSATVVDITAPDIDDTALTLTVWAVTASGATVTYPTPVATDADPTNPSVSCSPASGDNFPLGTTTVTCTSTDTAGNIGSQTFSVTITDTEDPILSLPSPDPVEVVAQSSSPVFFTISATDNVDTFWAPVTSGAAPAIVCSHLTGDTFNFGTTIVTCTATDSQSNDTTGSFNVVVQDTIKPTLSITLDDTTLNIGDTALVTFTFSETPVGFDNSDVTVENGTIDTIAGSGTIYTATLTPTAGVEDATNKITVGTDWSDANTPTGNSPVAATDSPNFVVDTLIPAQTAVVVTPLNGSVSVKLNTHENATVSLSYGFTNSYGSTADITTTAGTAHDKTILGLSPCTVYHYSIVATDIHGNISSSSDGEFTTLGVGSCTEPNNSGGSAQGGSPSSSDTTTQTNSESTNSNNTGNSTPTPPTTENTTPTTTPTNTTPETTPTPESTPTTPTENITPQANPEENNTPSPTPTPTPTVPVTGGGTAIPTGGITGPAFNPADATLDIGGAGTAEETPAVEEAPTVNPTLDVGGWVTPEETSYTLLWTLLGLIALLNTWWFFVAKNKTPTIYRRD